MKEQICRLCRRAITFDNFPTLEDDLRTTLDIFLSKLIPDVFLQQIMVCNECQDNLQAFYNFSRACGGIKNETLPIADCKGDVSLDVADIENTHVKTVGYTCKEDPMICRFCTKVVATPCFIFLNELKENLFMVNMLEELIPDLNLNNTEQILSCELCYNAYQGLPSFIMNCFGVEEEIRKYNEVDGTDDKSKMDLKKAQDFTFKPTLQQNIECCNAYKVEAIDEGQDRLVIKSEPDLLCDKVDDPEPIIIKEAVYIKLEKNDGDNNFQETLPAVAMDDGEIFKIDCSQCDTQSLTASSEIDKGQQISTRRSKRPPDSHSPSDKSHKCKLCTYRTKHKYSLNRHMSIHKNTPDLPVFKSEVSAFAKKHKMSMKWQLLMLKDPSKFKRHKCEFCAYETRYNGSMKMHMLIHEDPLARKEYKCKNCEFKTIHSRSIWRHMLTHRDPLNVKMYKCDVCTFQAKHKANLKTHMATHVAPAVRNRYKCKDCSYETIARSSMWRHSLTYKDPSEIPLYTCEICAYETRRKERFTLHLLTHIDPSERKKYKCNDCPFETVNKTCLCNHTMTHNDSLPKLMVKCEICPYETNRSESMKRHMMTHIDPSERIKYKCEECDYETITKRSMQQHALAHIDPSSVTMYKCEMCSYETKRSQTLKRHMLIHKDPSEREMFKCEECPYEARYRTSLKRHVLTHKDPSEGKM